MDVKDNFRIVNYGPVDQPSANQFECPLLGRIVATRATKHYLYLHPNPTKCSIETQGTTQGKPDP